MIELEPFTTIAEIAIAITGFTAIAAVVGKRAGGRWGHGERLQFMVLIRTSVIVLFFSFVPAVLSQLVLTEDMVWRISSGALGIALLIDVSWYLFRSKQTVTTVGQNILASVAFVVFAGLLASGAGFVGPYRLVFLLGLLFLLFVAVFNFVLLLVSGKHFEREDR